MKKKCQKKSQKLTLFPIAIVRKKSIIISVKGRDSRGTSEGMHSMSEGDKKSRKKIKKPLDNPHILCYTKCVRKVR